MKKAILRMKNQVTLKYFLLLKEKQLEQMQKQIKKEIIWICIFVMFL